jgi:flagellar protein FliO/FliZ
MSPVVAYIVETLVTLTGILALAVLVLYGGRRLGLGRPTGPLELLGRLPLDTRRAVYLVRVGKLVYVVGASEGGLTRLGELDADALPPGAPPAGGKSFAAILARAIRPAGEQERTAPPVAPRGDSTGGDV